MKNREGLKELTASLQNLILFAVVLWITFAFIIGVKMAPNDDMFPRISAGDILVYYRVIKQPAVQDVVVVKKNNTTYVGRVIAKGGDVVEITDEEALVVNGNMVIEDNIFYSTPYYEGFMDYPVRLEDDEVFILADKREGGEDSRYYGPVKQKEIKGIVIGQFRKNNI